MRPSIALESKRHAVREAASRFRTANPRLFGSALHGNDTEDSDLDLLVDATERTTLFTLAGLEHDARQLLGVEVTVLTAKDLPLKFRAEVLDAAQPL
jgi:predicted nucleotidyltransferase